MNTTKLWPSLGLILAGLISVNTHASGYNPDLYYMNGKGVDPWQLQIDFGESPIAFGEGESAKGSVVATPVEHGDGHATRLVWEPKGVVNE